jgi:hypothetical protein
MLVKNLRFDRKWISHHVRNDLPSHFVLWRSGKNSEAGLRADRQEIGVVNDAMRRQTARREISPSRTGHH